MPKSYSNNFNFFTTWRQNWERKVTYSENNGLKALNKNQIPRPETGFKQWRTTLYTLRDLREQLFCSAFNKCFHDVILFSLFLLLFFFEQEVVVKIRHLSEQWSPPTSNNVETLVLGETEEITGKSQVNSPASLPSTVPRSSWSCLFFLRQNKGYK